MKRKTNNQPNENAALSMFNQTVKYSGDAIFVKPVCDFFQIDYDYQLRRINSSELLKRYAGKNPDKMLFGDERERVTLTKKGFIAWILQINPQVVYNNNLRNQLVQYQSLIFDFMFGSMQRESIAKSMYARLNKLKRLKSKVMHEINRCDIEIDLYLENKFMQTQIDFDKEYNPSNDDADIRAQLTDDEQAEYKKGRIYIKPKKK
jgi:hypothetical protein